MFVSAYIIHNSIIPIDIDGSTPQHPRQKRTEATASTLSLLLACLLANSSYCCRAALWSRRAHGVPCSPFWRRAPQPRPLRRLYFHTNLEYARTGALACCLL